MPRKRTKEGPVRAKASVVLTERRVGELLRIRLDGAERWDVVDFIRAKEAEPGSLWEVSRGRTPLSEAMIWKLLQRADEAIVQSCDNSRKRLRRRHLAQRRNLYAKALLAGDTRTALACVEDEAKLLGLYPATKTKNETAVKGEMNLNHGINDPQQALAPYAELVCKFLAGGGPPAAAPQLPAQPVGQAEAPPEAGAVPPP
jgi:hypothetical protein